MVGIAAPNRRRHGIEDGEGGVALRLGLGNGAGDFGADVLQLLAELCQFHARLGRTHPLAQGVEHKYESRDKGGNQSCKDFKRHFGDNLPCRLAAAPLFLRCDNG